MTLNDRITEDLKKSMKSKDATRLSCLRMLRASMKNLQVEKQHTLNDSEIQGAISSLIKKGKDAAAKFSKAGREDLAQKEAAEVEVFYQYMPQQLTPEEIESTLKEIVVRLSADSPPDLGRVMKTAMAEMAGRAPGKAVNEIARKLLS